MNRTTCIRIARLAMAKRKSNASRETGYIFHHGLRTARLAIRLREQISKSTEVSESVLFTAALFHDVGKGREPHNHTGAVEATRLLAGEFEPDEIEALGRIIREHNRRKNNRRCWTASKIVQDADLLDHFGAHGVWLYLHHGASNDRTDAQTLKYYNCSDHQEHLAKSREALNFEISRLAFDRRVAYQRRFMDRLVAEIDGEL